MQSHGSRFASSMECLGATVRAGGIRQGLFKGFSVTFLRDCPNIGIYFASYEWLKKLLRADGRQDGAQNSQASILLAGGIAGMVCIPSLS